MNQALFFYMNNDRIFSISGFTLNLNSLPGPTDFYFGYRASSWGWGTWKNKWDQVDWEIRDYEAFKWNLKEQIKFQRGGSDMPRMLHKQMAGKIIPGQ